VSSTEQHWQAGSGNSEPGLPQQQMSSGLAMHGAARQGV